MKRIQEKNRKGINLALAFAIPSVGMLFVMLCSQYEPFGNISMLYSDMYHQYYPFFVAFRDALRSGKGLLYTWSVGMGMDYLGLIAYYLASPLNLLSIAVPESLLLEVYSLLMPIKLGLAALFFAIFLKNIFGRDDASIAVFGGAYGLCAWALGYQWNIMWLDTFALLPLVVLGTVYLLRDKKFILYTLTLFLSIFSNYYIGLFTCFFVFLFFFAYEICCWQGWKRFFCDLIRIGVFSVLAIGMTAVLTLPTLAALQTTQSSVNKFPTSFRLNISSDHTLKGLLDAMRKVAGNMAGCIEPSFKEGLPNVYCGTASILLLFLFLFAKEIKLREKICVVFLLLFFNVSFIIRQLDYIWHGFHFTNMIPYRFSFLYSFVMLYAAYRAWLLRDKFEVWHVALGTGLALGIVACSEELTAKVPLELGDTTLNIPVYFLFNLIFLLLHAFALLYVQAEEPIPENAPARVSKKAELARIRHRRTAFILALVFMGAELVGTLVSFGLYFPGTGVSNYPKGTSYTESVIRYMHEREEDNLFFRAETTHSQTLNDGAINGYNGVSTFTSSANVKTTLFMQALGYGAKNTYNRYCFEESSPVANLFLGLKYMIERDGKDRTGMFFRDANHFGQTTLLENTAYLPLGFLAEPGLEEVEFTVGGHVFSFQNMLFCAATGLQEGVWLPMQGEYLTIIPNGVTISQSTSTGYCQYQDSTSGSNVTYSYLVERDGFMCINLDLPKRNTFYVSINGVEQYKEKISLPQMIAVGDVKSGDIVEVRIECPAGESSTMTIDAGLLNTRVFWEGYEILAESTLELTAFESTFVEGVIDCNRDGLLYTSIPQNGNWSVQVDGQAAEHVLVGDCMIAVPLTQGSHTVSFVYRNAAFSTGALVSVACLAVFCGLVQICYKPDWKSMAQKLRKAGKFEK